MRGPGDYKIRVRYSLMFEREFSSSAYPGLPAEEAERLELEKDPGLYRALLLALVSPDLMVMVDTKIIRTQ